MSVAELVHVLLRFLALCGAKERRYTVNERFDATGASSIKATLWLPTRNEWGEMEKGTVEVTSIYGDEIEVDFPSLKGTFLVDGGKVREGKEQELQKVIVRLLTDAEKNCRVRCDEPNCGVTFDSPRYPTDDGDAESGPMAPEEMFCPAHSEGEDDGEKGP